MVLAHIGLQLSLTRKYNFSVIIIFLLFCFRRSLRHRERRPAYQERQHRRRRHIHLQSQGLGNREPRRKRHQAGGEKIFLNYQLKSQFKTQAGGMKTYMNY
jgi:hypothetical protein